MDQRTPGPCGSDLPMSSGLELLEDLPRILEEPQLTQATERFEQLKRPRVGRGLLVEGYSCYSLWSSPYFLGGSYFTKKPRPSTSSALLQTAAPSWLIVMLVSVDMLVSTLLPGQWSFPMGLGS